MKKSNKKGFTIVELVIVIAVIAILAAVLIPTFSNVINKANESAALQAVRNAYSQSQIALSGSGRALEEGTYFSDEDGKYFFKLDGSGIVKANDEPANKEAFATLENGVRVYGVKIEKTATIDASSGDPVVLFAEPIKGASSCTLTVYDADGNQYYKESATVSNNSNFATGLYFCMYNTSGVAGKKDVTWDAKATVSNKLANCMKDADAYGWYSYVLEYKGTNNTEQTVTGVFYYGE